MTLGLNQELQDLGNANDLYVPDENPVVKAYKYEEKQEIERNTERICDE